MIQVELPDDIEKTLREAKNVAAQSGNAKLVGSINTVLFLLETSEFTIHEVHSDWIRCLMYDGKKILRVVKKNGEAIQYGHDKQPITPEFFQFYLCESQKSAGKAYNTYLRGKYDSQVVA